MSFRWLLLYQLQMSGLLGLVFVSHLGLLDLCLLYFLGICDDYSLLVTYCSMLMVYVCAW